jgi:hypothetical protein
VIIIISLSLQALDLNSIQIPIYLTNSDGNTVQIDLIIPLNSNYKLKEDLMTELCLEHNVNVVACNNIKLQAIKTIEYVENNLKYSSLSSTTSASSASLSIPTTDSFNKNGIITIPFSYRSQGDDNNNNGEVIEHIFEVREDEVLMKLKLTSFCFDHRIDNDSCGELYNIARSSIKLRSSQQITNNFNNKNIININDDGDDDNDKYDTTKTTASTIDYTITSINTTTKTSIDDFVNITLNAAYHHQLDKNSYPNVYYAIFAGRLQFLKIHLEYCNILLELKYITEVHIWDFTINQDEDKEFINTFIRDTTLHGYRLFERSKNHTINNNAMNSNEYLWTSFYHHYGNNDKYYADDILIKADDDIVFIDISQFPVFIKQIMIYKDEDKNDDKYLHFPNIINNDVGFVIQAARIMYDKILLKWMNYYQDKYHIDFNVLFNSFYTNIHYIEPITTLDDGIYMKPEFAEDVHNLFLRNPLNFIQSMHYNYTNLSKIIQFKRRISINMYAAKFKNIRKIYNLFLNHHCCGDEAFIGSLPWRSNTYHLIHADFVISHFAYKPQYNYNNEKFHLSLSLILERYRNLSSSFEKQFNKKKMKKKGNTL